MLTKQISLTAVLVAMQRNLLAKLEMVAGIWMEQRRGDIGMPLKQLKPTEQQAYLYMLQACQQGVEAALREANATPPLQEARPHTCACLVEFCSVFK